MWAVTASPNRHRRRPLTAASFCECNGLTGPCFRVVYLDSFALGQTLTVYWTCQLCRSGRTVAHHGGGGGTRPPSQALHSGRLCLLRRSSRLGLLRCTSWQTRQQRALPEAVTAALGQGLLDRNQSAGRPRSSEKTWLLNVCC